MKSFAEIRKTPKSFKDIGTYRNCYISELACNKNKSIKWPNNYVVLFNSHELKIWLWVIVHPPSRRTEGGGGVFRLSCSLNLSNSTITAAQK